MADTSGPHKTLRSKTFGTVFRIDPEGNVQMTWQTLIFLIAFAISATWWCSSVYEKVSRIPAIEAEQKLHREVLIEGGLLRVARASE